MGGVYIKNKWLPYLLILPTIILICIFKIYPIIDSVIPVSYTHLDVYKRQVWESLPGRADKQYFHAFHKKQPDLNWENPEVREEVYKNINWWLDKGLGGFRVDAIINIKKKLPFQDYPTDREDGLSDMGPVSYTHLDVYKRQLYRRSLGQHELL